MNLQYIIGQYCKTSSKPACETREAGSRAIATQWHSQPTDTAPVSENFFLFSFLSFGWEGTCFPNEFLQFRATFGTCFPNEFLQFRATFGWEGTCFPNEFLQFRATFGWEGTCFPSEFLQFRATQILRWLSYATVSDRVHIAGCLCMYLSR